MSAELSARRTAASAVLGDYRRAVLSAPSGGAVTDWLAWAHRLAIALASVLDQLDTEGANR